jgi:hypothetical protein
MLGEALELMHTTTDRWTTVRATIEEWSDQDLLAFAAERTSDAVFGAGSRPPGAPSRHGHGVRETRHVLVARSDRAVRLESRLDDGTHLVVLGADGSVLTVGPDGAGDSWPGARLSIGWLHLGLVGAMLAPDLIAGAFRLRVSGTATVAGRGCLVAEALGRPEHLRQSRDLFGHGVPGGIVTIDRATGLVLRAEAVDAGQVVRRAEMTEVEVDGPPAEDALFSTEAPPGSGRPDPARRRSLPLREAAACLPFALLAPPPTDEDYPWTALLTGPPPGATGVVLHRVGGPLRPGRGLVSITESADPKALPDTAGWRSVTVDGLPAHAWEGGGTAHLTAWREGTGVWIQNADGPADAEVLLRSLRPVDRTG